MDYVLIQFDIELSEKDDMESLIYLIVYLCSNCKMFNHLATKSEENILKFKSCNFYK